MAVNVETPDPPVEMTPSNDSETEGYVNTESEKEDKQPVIGTLVMKTVGIVKRKKKRKACCKICGTSCDHVKELNQYHKDTHDIVCFAQIAAKPFLHVPPWISICMSTKTWTMCATNVVKVFLSRAD